MKHGLSCTFHVSLLHHACAVCPHLAVSSVTRAAAADHDATQRTEEERGRRRRNVARDGAQLAIRRMLVFYSYRMAGPSYSYRADSSIMPLVYNGRLLPYLDELQPMYMYMCHGLSLIRSLGYQPCHPLCSESSTFGGRIAAAGETVTV